MLEFCALDITNQYSNPDIEERYQVFKEQYNTNEGACNTEYQPKTEKIRDKYNRLNSRFPKQR